MISLGARSVPRTENSLPFYSEPVTGQVTIAAPQGLILRIWDARSGKMRSVPATYRSGRYSLVLDSSLRSYWLLLDAPQNPRQ